MHIKVLGSGYKKCHETDKVLREAVAEAGSDAAEDYIMDIAEIAKHGIFSAPAVIVDGDARFVGKIPSKADAKGWLWK